MGIYENKRRIFIVCICIGIAIFLIKQNSSLGNLSDKITLKKVVIQKLLLA